jgi:hypothetical protein
MLAWRLSSFGNCSDSGSYPLAAGAADPGGLAAGDGVGSLGGSGTEAGGCSSRTAQDANDT